MQYKYVNHAEFQRTVKIVGQSACCLPKTRPVAGMPGWLAVCHHTADGVDELNHVACMYAINTATGEIIDVHDNELEPLARKRDLTGACAERLARARLANRPKRAGDDRDLLAMLLASEDDECDPYGITARKKETSAAMHSRNARKGTGAKRARKTSRNERAAQAVTADGKDDGYARGGFVENLDQEHAVKGRTPKSYDKFYPITRDDEWSFEAVGVDRAVMDKFCDYNSKRPGERRVTLGDYIAKENDQTARAYVSLVERADGRIEMRYRAAYNDSGNPIKGLDQLIGFVPKIVAVRMRACIEQGKHIEVDAHQLYWHDRKTARFGHFTVHARVVD